MMAPRTRAGPAAGRRTGAIRRRAEIREEGRSIPPPARTAAEPAEGERPSRRPPTRPRTGAVPPPRDETEDLPREGETLRRESDWARPLVRENLSEAACRALRAALTEGRLRPGAALPLRPMSRRFAISVTPMREAMLRLAGERALSIDARGAASVPVLTTAQVDEIVVLREDLEGRAAAQAAARATPAEIDRLAEINEELVLRHAAGEIPEAVRLNTRFHLEACRLGGSPILSELVEGLWVRSGPLLWHSIDAHAPRWRPGPHRDLIAALRARDPEAARAAMVADAARWARGYRRYAAPVD